MTRTANTCQLGRHLPASTVAARCGGRASAVEPLIRIVFRRAIPGASELLDREGREQLRQHGCCRRRPGTYRARRAETPCDRSPSRAGSGRVQGMSLSRISSAPPSPHTRSLVSWNDSAPRRRPRERTIRSRVHSVRGVLDHDEAARHAGNCREVACHAGVVHGQNRPRVRRCAAPRLPGRDSRGVDVGEHGRAPDLMTAFAVDTNGSSGRSPVVGPSPAISTAISSAAVHELSEHAVRASRVAQHR